MTDLYLFMVAGVFVFWVGYEVGKLAERKRRLRLAHQESIQEANR